jgi:hypothetical protein
MTMPVTALSSRAFWVRSEPRMTGSDSRPPIAFRCNYTGAGKPLIQQRLLQHCNKAPEYVSSPKMHPGRIFKGCGRHPVIIELRKLYTGLPPCLSIFNGLFA